MRAPDAANPLLTERLLVSPWWSIHRDVIRDAVYAEMSRLGTIVAVEVCVSVRVLQQD
jgi:hypothetical protein